eukprot:jgi/Chlat1/3799/Chrsp259S03932
MGGFGGMMNKMRRADRNVFNATHPAAGVKNEINRHNPVHQVEMDMRRAKNHATAPLHPGRNARNRMNRNNPVFYMKRMVRNVTGCFR